MLVCIFICVCNLVYYCAFVCILVVLMLEWFVDDCVAGCVLVVCAF